VQILLVEDDQKLSRLLARRLSAEGHGAATAATGPEGLELAGSGRFDLAIVDVMLPVMDGRELTRILREKGSRMPVLMLTARDAVGDRVAGLRSGADDYLVKPFAFDELLARIEALGRRAGRSGRLSAGGVELDPA